MNRSGNHMITDHDPKPNPDDYDICQSCGRACHLDDMDHRTCRECFEVQEHEYFCQTCGQEFKYYGIPAHCLCGHYGIDFDTRKVDGWLEEVQEAHLRKLEAEPMQTPGIIESMKPN
jgi:hypothetical protein